MSDYNPKDGNATTRTSEMWNNTGDYQAGSEGSQSNR